MVGIWKIFDGGGGRGGGGEKGAMASLEAGRHQERPGEARARGCGAGQGRQFPLGLLEVIVASVTSTILCLNAPEQRNVCLNNHPTSGVRCRQKAPDPRTQKPITSTDIDGA